VGRILDLDFRVWQVGRLKGLPNLANQRGGVVATEQEGEGGAAVVADGEALDHAGGQEVLPHAGIDDPSQRHPCGGERCRCH
jgi:hypothetical protein